MQSPNTGVGRRLSQEARAGRGVNGSLLMSLVATPAARNKITTREMAQGLIDRFEEAFPHDEMPPHYDWLIAHRDSLPKVRRKTASRS